MQRNESGPPHSATSQKLRLRRIRTSAGSGCDRVDRGVVVCRRRSRSNSRQESTTQQQRGATATYRAAATEMEREVTRCTTIENLSSPSPLGHSASCDEDNGASANATATSKRGARAGDASGFLHWAHCILAIVFLLADSPCMPCEAARCDMLQRSSHERSCDQRGGRLQCTA